MGLFNYESSGAGIPKNAEKKTGAKLFFDIWGRKFWKLFEVNMLYFIFFIPLMSVPIALRIPNTLASEISIITLLFAFAIVIGPATAGMTRIMRCFLIEKHCFIVRDFFNGFKSNFKKGSIIGFLDCIAVLSAYASINVYPALAVQLETKLMYVPMVIAFSIVLVFLMMNYYIYLMLVATNLSLKNLFKNSFALAFVAIKNNFITFFLSAILIGIMLILFRFVPAVCMMIFPFFPAALICFITCFNSYPIIQKYVINPYYTSIGEVNPELIGFNNTSDEETIFEDMGGKEKPIEKRKKGKGKRIS